MAPSLGFHFDSSVAVGAGACQTIKSENAGHYFDNLLSPFSVKLCKYFVSYPLSSVILTLFLDVLDGWWWSFSLVFFF